MLLTQGASGPGLDRPCFLKIPNTEDLISGRIYKELVRALTSGKGIGRLRAREAEDSPFTVFPFMPFEFRTHVCAF